MTLSNNAPDNGRVISVTNILQARRAERRRTHGTSRLFWLSALIPVAAAALYIFFAATPMYSTEARFTIQGIDATAPAPQAGGILSSGMAGANPMAGLIDGYAVRDFLQSREALQRLTAKIDFAALVEGRAGDPLVRVPENASPDRLYAAYRSFVQVRYNMIEQIVVLDVRAFSPADSVEIAKALLATAEEFVDKMNKRARDDASRVAEQSVKEAEARDRAARTAVMTWRRKNRDIDPTLDVTMLTNLIAQQETQLAQAQSELAVIARAGIAETPRRETLEHQVSTLQGQIAQERRRLTGSDSTASSRLYSYQALQSELAFAESNLVSMRQTAEQARLDVMRQQKFVAVVAEPLEGAEPSYPDKTEWLGIALAAGLALSFIGSVIIGRWRTRWLSK